jgi:hypothetical protein
MKERKSGPEYLNNTVLMEAFCVLADYVNFPNNFASITTFRVRQCITTGVGTVPYNLRVRCTVPLVVTRVSDPY